MNISSPAFSNNTLIPSRYSHQGGNVSPPLELREVPEGTKSLALICHDPDAPRKEGFIHWVVWNINPTVTTIEENTLPAGAVEGTTDWGATRWDGPQPPSGTHRYIFYLYALDTTLHIPTSTTAPTLQKTIVPHIIASTYFTGLFTA